MPILNKYPRTLPKEYLDLPNMPIKEKNIAIDANRIKCVC